MVIFLRRVFGNRPTDSYYEFEPEDVNKENLSIAEMSGKKLDWFRKVCAAVL